MNNQAAPPQTKSGLNRGRFGAYVGLPALVVATLFIAPRIHKQWILPDSSWPSFPAHVLGTRVVSAGTLENSWGTSFMYRVDIHASWIENGARMDAWVPTQKESRDKTWLALWASQQGFECIVRESPRNPSQKLAAFR